MSWIENNGVPVKEGAYALLDWLKEACHIPLALVTSTEQKRTESYFALTRLGSYFDVTVYGDEVSQGKPHPMIYQKALERLGLMASECLAIEDSSTGVLSAASAGLDTIVVPDCVQPSLQVLKRCLSRAQNLYEVKTILQYL